MIQVGCYQTLRLLSDVNLNETESIIVNALH